MPTPNLITLTSDFGKNSMHVGQIHGVIAITNPDARIIDLTHEIEKYNIQEAAFIIGNSYRYFPEGTIHCVIVDPGIAVDRKILAVRTERYVFLAPDNGVLSLVLEQEKPLSIVNVENRKYFASRFHANTFHGRSIFAPAAAHLAGGLLNTELGMECPDLCILDIPKAIVEENSVRGNIIYIDHFGNLVTNIHRHNILELLKHNKPLELEAGNVTVGHFGKAYADAAKGELLFLINSFDMLEIAANQANAAAMLPVETGDEVRLQRVL